MKTVADYGFLGKKALVRVDFNVPLNRHFEITDDTRIKAALPTINKILDDGGAVILVSHLGRPKGVAQDKFSLRHIVGHLSELLNMQVKFADDCIGETAKTTVAGLQSGEVLLLENLRFYIDETEGNQDFAEKLSHYGDVFINDAFSMCHRAHASIEAIIRFFPNNKLFGIHVANELNSINKLLNQPESPFTAIIGGAKVTGKIDIINHLLEKVDNLLIGGGMAYTFIKALGGKIGGSLIEKDRMETASDIIRTAEQKGVSLHLPSDAVAANDFSNQADTQISPANAVPNGWTGLDIGPETMQKYTEIISSSKTILWNGPMGVFEFSNFGAGTRGMAEAIAAATSQGAYSVIGGGDSVAAINKYQLAGGVSHVSTGGGALLDYIGGKALPGIKAILEPVPHQSPA